MKKKILVISLVVSLVAVAALGATLAYFTDTSEVDNVFTMGNISIDLKEIVGYDGETPLYGTPGEDGDVDFGTVLPGSEKDKAPFVINTGDNDAYVQLEVTINNSAEFDAMFSAYKVAHPDAPLSITDFIQGIDNTNWTYAGNEEDTGKNTRTYTYTYNEIVEPLDETTTLFTTVVIPDQLDGEFAAAGITGFEIGIVAKAIQADNFATPAAAFAELNK